MNSIFSNFKRKSRPRARVEHASPSKAKPLDILPGLAETEEEGSRSSTSSFASSSSSPSGTYLTPTYNTSRSTCRPALAAGARLSRTMDLAERKRDSRRVVLTGAEGLTFEDFFPLTDDFPRPAPPPPTIRPISPELKRPFSGDLISSESPLGSIDLRFSGFNLPFDCPTSPCTVRSHSPTPSVASNRTTSTVASSSSTSSAAATITPPTSDDEANTQLCSNLTRAPTYKSHRASVHYLKAIPAVQRTMRDSEPLPPLPTEDEIDSDDVCWFAQELSDIVTMYLDSPEFDSFSAQHFNSQRARPDSVSPVSRSTTARARPSRPPSVVPRIHIQEGSLFGPSTQLDPTFPQPKRRTPSRPPPPPPIRIEPPSSPTMEEKTDELLALLANAALDSCFLGTGLGDSAMELPPSVPVTPSSAFAIITPIPSRPPPRMSVPADISDFIDDDRSSDEGELQVSDDSDESVEFDLNSLPNPDWPPTPEDCITSQESMLMSLDSIPIEPETPRMTDDFYLSMYGTVAEQSPLSPAMPDSPITCMYTSDPAPRVLRSRWSSSTLSSLADTRQASASPTSWKLRFHLGSTSLPKARRVKSVSERPSLNSSLFTLPGQGSSIYPRRDSHASNDYSSDDTTATSGLRRKPIPVEIFMRA